MKSIRLIVLVVAALLVLPFLFPAKEGGQVAGTGGEQPWQIEILPDGATRVFGLIPGRSTLEDARRHFATEPSVALIVAPGENGSLEAYFDSIDVAGIAGKMVLTLHSSAEQRAQMLQRAVKAEYMKSTTREVALSEQDRMLADRAAIEAIAFIPAANLDAQIILDRFGTPAERLRSSAHREHFLYPAKGLEVQLDSEGKEVLQYVPPAEFGRIRDPLVAADGKGS